VHWIEPSNAPETRDLGHPQRVRVTHPFHPLAGQELEFVKRRKSWQLDRVYVYDTAGELVSLPVEWTDVVALDPFVVVSGGRSLFHIGGLAELADLVVRLTADRPSSVKGTTP